MYTREQAVKESIEKWEGIVAGEFGGDSSCGFCRMKEELDPVPWCDEWCPIEKAGVCADDGFYQQWMDNPTKTNAEKVLAGVRKYGKLWIAEG